jgi:WD40 repeat protein
MTPCPARGQLEALLAGELGPEDDADLARHVEGCAACQAVLEGWTSIGGPTTDAGRDGAESPRAEGIGRLRPLLPPMLSGVTEGPDGEPSPATVGRASEDPMLRTPDPTGPLSLQAGAAPRRVGRYEVLRELGRGGMGVVYLGRDPQLKRLVALKMLLRAGYSDREAWWRFRAEAEAVARLDHPNIVKLHEFGDHEGHPYFVLEYLGGGTLARWTRGRPQPPAVCAAVIRTLAQAIHYAHQQGVIHRDLKPANILLQESEVSSQESEAREGRAGPADRLLMASVPCLKITDFGLAKRVIAEESTAAAPTLTQTGDVIGTPTYMAPEQAAGRPRAVGPATDVYALGVLLYELLTGRPPFTAPTWMEVLSQIEGRDPIPPGRLQPKVPRDLETICLKCLQKAPDRRYASAWDLAEDLRRFQGGEPIIARPVGPWERGWKWVRRRPAIAGLLLAVVCVAALGFAGVLWQWREAEAASHKAVESAGELRRERDQARWQVYRANLKAASSALANHNINLVRAALEAAPEEYRGWEWRHFHSRLDSTQAVLRQGIPSSQAKYVEVDYQPPMRNIAVSPDGKTIATGSTDGTVELWEARTGRLRGRLAGHAGPVSAVAFSPDRTRLVSRVNDALYLWDPADGRLIAVLRGHRAFVTTFEFSPDGRFLISGGQEDDVVRWWDAHSGTALKTFAIPGRGCYYTKFNPDGQRVAFVALEGQPPRMRGTFWLLDTRTGVKKQILPDLPPWSVTFSPDGGALACGADWPDNRVRLTDADSGKVLHVLAGHKNRVTRVAFSPDGARLVSASMDQTARLWDAKSGKLLAVLAGHSHQLHDVQFSPDGSRIFTCSQDKTIRIWDGRTGELVAVVLGHAAGVWGLALEREGALMVSEDQHGEVRLWDVKVAEFQGALRGHTSFVYDAAFSPDGQLIASAAWDDTIRLWNPLTGRHRVLAGSGTITTALAFHPTGKQVASLSRQRGICLWDVATGKLEWEKQVEVGVTEGVRPAFHPDGSILAAGSRDGVIRFWNPQNGDLVAELPRQSSAAKAICFNRDGSLLASVWADGMVRLWDVRSRTVVGGFQGHGRGIEAVTFSPDGRWIATASQDGAVRIWDVKSLEQLAVLTHPGEVYDVAFSPDGTRVASACADHALHLWDVKTWEEVAQLAGHGDYVHSVAFSADGSRLVSGSGDFTARVWDTVSLKVRVRQALPSGKE